MEAAGSQRADLTGELALLLLLATSRHLVFPLLQILYCVPASKLRHTVTTWL